MITLNMVVGWLGFAAGALSGALIGLRFHRENWLGGYGSLRRRLLRLGHIACFGVGFLNVLFSLSADQAGVRDGFRWAGASMAAAQVAMPAVCFLSAWRISFRHLFALPVLLICAGVFGMILNFFGV